MLTKIKLIIYMYLSHFWILDDSKPNQRDGSFNYCVNHFKRAKGYCLYDFFRLQIVFVRVI